MCGFCNVWVCVCVGFVMRGCFCNICTCIYCVLCCLYCVFCIVSFMYIYSYLYYLYWCKDCCHRVETQLQLVIKQVSKVIIIIIIIKIKKNNNNNSVFLSHVSISCQYLIQSDPTLISYALSIHTAPAQERPTSYHQQLPV